MNEQRIFYALFATVAFIAALITAGIWQGNTLYDGQMRACMETHGLWQAANGSFTGNCIPANQLRGLQ